MANQIIDILRLFIDKASFLGGSKRSQFGVDKTLKQLLIHNDTDDTLVDEWSGDSLQTLLAGTQTITGIKTINNTLIIQDNNEIQLRDGTTGISSSGAGSLELNSDTELSIDSPLAKFGLGGAGDSVTIKSGSGGLLTFETDADGDASFNKKVNFSNNIEITDALALNSIITFDNSGDMSITVDTGDLYIGGNEGLHLEGDIIDLQSDGDYTFLSLQNVDMSACQTLKLAASDTGYATLNLPQSIGFIASPNDGDMWYDTDGLIHYYDAGSAQEYTLDRTAYP